MEEDNKPPKKIITVIRKEENNKTTQVVGKNNFLVDPLETNNRMEKGTSKRLEEVENSFNSLLEKLNKQITLQEQKNQDLHQENNRLVGRVSSLETENKKLIEDKTLMINQFKQLKETLSQERDMRKTGAKSFLTRNREQKTCGES